jgi:hypothetical protein
VYLSGSNSNQEPHNYDEISVTLKPAVDKANKSIKALQEVDSKSINLPGMQTVDQEKEISEIPFNDVSDAEDHATGVNKNISFLYTTPYKYEDMLKGQYSREKLISEQLKTICEKLNFTSCSAFLFSGSSVLECAGSWDKNEEIRIKLIKQETKLHSNFAVQKVLKSQEHHTSKNLYGELQFLKSTDYSNPEVKSVLEIYGTNKGEFEIILIPIHGFNRTYGYLRAVRYQKSIIKYVQELSIESTSSFDAEDADLGLGIIYQLCLRAARLGSILKEAKRSEQLRLIVFLQRIDFQWSVINEDIKKLNFQGLKDYLDFYANFLTSSEYRCVNSVTLRLVLGGILYEVSHKTYKEKGSKDNSPRSIDEQPSNIVSNVINDGLDIYYYNIDDPVFNKKYNLKNQEWIKLNNFSTLSCLAIKVKNQTIGTLSFFSGKHQVLGEEDRRFLRIVADLAATFLSKVLYDINANQNHLENTYVRSFIDNIYPVDKVRVPESLHHKTFSIVSACSSTNHAAEKLDDLFNYSHNVESTIYRTLTPDNYLLRSDYTLVIIDEISLTDFHFTRQIWPRILLNYRSRQDAPIILVSIDKFELPYYMEIFKHTHNALMQKKDFLSLFEYIKDVKIEIRHAS